MKTKTNILNAIRVPGTNEARGQTQNNRSSRDMEMPTMRFSRRGVEAVVILCAMVIGSAPWAHGGPVGAEGDLYVSSYGSDEVIQFDGATGSLVGTFVSDPALDGPGGLVFNPWTGNLLVSGYESNNIVEFDGTTGELIGVFAEAAELQGPTGMTMGPDGNLFVASYDNDSVIEFNGVTGEFVGVFASGSGLDGPEGVLFKPDGNLLVAGGFSDNVVEFGTLGEFIREFSGGGLDYPGGLVFRDNGNLLVANGYGDNILEFDAGTGAYVGVFGYAALGSFPDGLAFGPNGNLFSASWFGNTVQEFDGDTGVLLGEFVSGGGLDQAYFLVFKPKPIEDPVEALTSLLIGGEISGGEFGEMMRELRSPGP